MLHEIFGHPWILSLVQCSGCFFLPDIPILTRKQFPGLASGGLTHSFILVRGGKLEEGIEAQQAPCSQPANTGICIIECNLFQFGIIRIQLADGFSPYGRIAVTPSRRE